MALSDGPASVAQVKADLSLVGTADDDQLARVVAAVNSRVRVLPVAQLPDDATEWPAHVERGANMLAARLFRRRNTPTGVEAIGDTGLYVRRNDPDIALLLQLGDYAKPAVG